MIFRFLLAAFATYRLAQMVVFDDLPFALMKNLREKVTETQAEPGSLKWSIQALLTCPFCVGVWLAACMALLVTFPTSIGDFILLVFAIAGVQSFLEAKGPGG